MALIAPTNPIFEATNLSPAGPLEQGPGWRLPLDSTDISFLMNGQRCQSPAVRPNSFSAPYIQASRCRSSRALVGGASFCSSIVFLLFLAEETAARKASMSRWVGITLGFWVLGPPLWFAAEYFLVNGVLRFYFYPQAPLPCPESFQYSQELASKIWVAAVAVLVAVYQRKVPGTLEDWTRYSLLGR